MTGKATRGEVGGNVRREGVKTGTSKILLDKKRVSTFSTFFGLVVYTERAYQFIEQFTIETFGFVAFLN